MSKKPIALATLAVREAFQSPEDCFIPKPGLTRDAIWDAAVTLLKRAACALEGASGANEALSGLASQLDQFGDLMDGVRA